MLYNYVLIDDDMDEETTSQESVDSETPMDQKDDDSKTQELYICDLLWKKD